MPTTKSAKEAISQLKKERFEQGEIRVVSTDSITADGFHPLSKFIARKKYLTPATKIVWSVICNHAWHDKDHCFPGRETLAEETGLDPKTVTRALKQLQGENERNEVYMRVIHRGHGLTNVYELLFKMNGDKLDYVTQKLKSKKGQNVLSNPYGDLM